MSRMDVAPSSKKRGYHHGDLKAALVEAAEILVAEHGALDFTLADASRRAGVSAAAPYRHFADKEALLDAVRARGFTRLGEAMGAAALARAAPGTVDEIVAIGEAYVRFAIKEPAIFRLMFGPRHTPEPTEAARDAGAACFGVLLTHVDRLRRANGFERPDTRTLAMPLWSMVHGLATLAIDQKFDTTAPGTDPVELVDFANRSFLDRVIQQARTEPDTLHLPRVGPLGCGGEPG